MTTYAWEKNDGSGWVPFSGTPTVANPTESFAAGTWDVRVTVTEGVQSVTETRLDYVIASAASSDYEGPLDLVPGAVVAYGVRALSAARLGQNIFRLRRDSDDAEMDFAADATTGEAPVASIATWLGGANGILIAWYDQSGNDIHIAPYDADHYALWNATGGGNNKPCFVGSGTGGYFSTEEAAFPSGQYGFFVAYKGTGNFKFMVGINDVDIRTNSSIFAKDGTNEAGIAITGDMSIFSVFDGTWEFGARSCLQNGADITTGANFDFGSPPIGPISETVEVSTTDADDAFRSEIIVYPSLLSDPSRTSARQNIAAYYGITLS